MKTGLFGDRRVGVVSLVEAPLSRFYAHKARVAFFATSAVVGLLALVVASSVAPLLVAVLAGALLGVGCGLAVAVLVRAWPVLRVIWWWSFEIGVVSGLAAGLVWLSGVTSPLMALLMLALLVGSGWLARPVRRFVSAWAWCVVVRHRLRLCFAEFIRAVVRTHPLSLPLILAARPTPAGERVWVWLRPGLDLTDLDGKTDKLAVACWAGAVRVVRASARHAALIRVDITRRDPLTGLVGSPLAEWFDTADTAAESNVPVSPGMPPWGLDLDEVPEPPPEPRTARR